jgi:hypothetical protein
MFIPIWAIVVLTVVIFAAGYASGRTSLANDDDEDEDLGERPPGLSDAAWARAQAEFRAQQQAEREMD